MHESIAKVYVRPEHMKTFYLIRPILHMPYPVVMTAADSGKYRQWLIVLNES